MADLHLLLVIDSETGKVWLEGMETAPVDSDEFVFDDPEWRPPTENELNVLAEVEGKVHDALIAAELHR